jgi:hypothetical protein
MVKPRSEALMAIVSWLILIHHWFLSDTSMVPMVPAKKNELSC